MTLVVWELSRGRDADDHGAAGANGATLYGLECFVEADFDGGEVVIATADGKAFARNPGVFLHEEVHHLVGRHGGLAGEALQFGRHSDVFVSGSGGGEEGVCREPRAGAMGAPLVLEKSLVGVDVFIGGGVGGTCCVGAVFGISAVVILRPEAVEDKGGVRGALGCIRVGVAELGRPGEVEEIVIKTGADRKRGVLSSGGRVWRREAA